MKNRVSRGLNNVCVSRGLKADTRHRPLKADGMRKSGKNLEIKK